MAPLAALAGLDNGGLVDTGDYEIVQANKNALSIAFETIGTAALGLPAEDPVLLQREAYALYRGMAAYFGLEQPLRADLVITVADARTGRPIRGARALLDGVLPLGSDPGGTISFLGLRPRDYHLTVTADGYGAVELTVPAGAGRPIQLELSPLR